MKRFTGSTIYAHVVHEDCPIIYSAIENHKGLSIPHKYMSSFCQVKQLAEIKSRAQVRSMNKIGIGNPNKCKEKNIALTLHRRLKREREVVSDCGRD